MVRPSGTRGIGSTSVGRPTRTLSCELVLVAGRPCDPPGCAASADPELSCCPLLPPKRQLRRAANFLPEVWLPDADTERLRRQVARRNQVVRHRTRIKNEVHAILAAHLVPPCPHDLFAQLGRQWLSRQMLPDDERAAWQRVPR